jgi:hypothetical protein
VKTNLDEENKNQNIPQMNSLTYRGEAYAHFFCSSSILAALPRSRRTRTEKSISALFNWPLDAAGAVARGEAVGVARTGAGSCGSREVKGGARMREQYPVYLFDIRVDT